jgi:Asp-tRNA(Asn)/Glu-tRNA(Gln) amidotransferase A subunit family amidase
LLNELSATELVRRIAAGETTAEAAVQAQLARIEAREESVLAWTFLDPQRSLANARERDRDPFRGPLHGLPIGIKDIMDTADMPTAYGSPIYRDHRPAADAACVALLRDAGAIILGKTETTEFATTYPGRTRNPHDLTRTPGGSSSGSAAAVADAMVPVALGTQTMGSVIRPAAYCGIVGYKPSFGLINRAGIKPQAESIDTVGVLGRSIDDVALVAAVLMGARPNAFDGSSSGAPRIIVYRGPDWSKVEAASESVLDSVVQRLADSRATIEEIGHPRVLSDALDAHLTIVVYELARALAYEWFRHRKQISPALTALVEQGWGATFERYRSAQEIASEARLWFGGTFGTTDLWLTVSAPGEAPEGLTSTGDPVLNRVWSLLHVPVVTLPAGRGPNGLPIGVQLIGAYRRDAELLAAARWVAARLA